MEKNNSKISVSTGILFLLLFACIIVGIYALSMWLSEGKEIPIQEGQNVKIKPQVNKLKLKNISVETKPQEKIQISAKSIEVTPIKTIRNKGETAHKLTYQSTQLTKEEIAQYEANNS